MFLKLFGKTGSFLFPLLCERHNNRRLNYIIEYKKKVFGKQPNVLGQKEFFSGDESVNIKYGNDVHCYKEYCISKNINFTFVLVLLNKILKQ